MLYSCQDILPLAQKPVALQRRLGLLWQGLRDINAELVRLVDVTLQVWELHGVDVPVAARHDGLRISGNAGQRQFRRARLGQRPAARRRVDERLARLRRARHVQREAVRADLRRREPADPVRVLRRRRVRHERAAVGHGGRRRG